jgi:hypothetical protein
LVYIVKKQDINNMISSYNLKTIQFYHKLLNQIVVTANHESAEEKNLRFTDIHIRKLQLKSGINLEQFYSILFAKITPSINFTTEIVNSGSKFTPVVFTIKITPIVRRLIQPHRSISLEATHRILVTYLLQVKHEVSFYNDSNKWDQFTKKYRYSSDDVKVEKISSIIQKISSSQEYKYLLSKLRIHYTEITDFSMLVFSKMINSIDLTDVVSIAIAKDNISKLFDLQPHLIKVIKASIHKTIKNIILGNKGRIQIRIVSHSDLKRFIHILRELNIIIYPVKIIQSIENDIDLIDYLNGKSNKFNWDNTIIHRITSIISCWVKDPQFKKPGKNKIETGEFNIETIQFKMKEKIRRRSYDKLDQLIAKENRNTNISGKHHIRNSRLPYLVKERSDFTCERCFSKESKEVIIEVSHVIPLYFGFGLGGVDKSWNMEVLCHNCHMIHEEEFENQILNNQNLQSKKDLIEFLKITYPLNFVTDSSTSKINFEELAKIDPIFIQKLRKTNLPKRKRLVQVSYISELKQLIRDHNKLMKICKTNISYKQLEAKTLSKTYKLYSFRCNICEEYHIIESRNSVPVSTVR